ncbi:unnamed protein product [Rotaria socialis]|uniref:Uncharacterized protein n=1 Tax=Rotaria socialis TaxID=392032 RepID=A0A818THC5_9BILA|nr:unnamed protein product [Rotaria socialis]
MEGNQTAENFTGTPTGQFIPNNNQPESPPPPYDQVTQQRSNNQSNRRNENGRDSSIQPCCCICFGQRGYTYVMSISMISNTKENLYRVTQQPDTSDKLEYAPKSNETQSGKSSSRNWSRDHWWNCCCLWYWCWWYAYNNNQSNSVNDCCCLYNDSSFACHLSGCGDCDCDLLT